MAFSIVRLKMSDEFLDQDEHYRFNWVQEWCEQYLQPVLAALDPDLNTFFGGDFARSGLTVNCILQQQPDLKLHTPLTVELRNVAFDYQKQIYTFIVDSLPRFQCGALDARGNGQYLAESMMLLYGENIKQVMLSPKWYLENMPRFKAHFEDKTLLAPKDADVLSDLRSIKMDKGFAKVPDDAVVKGSDGLMRHGDSAIALALGVFASIQEVEIFAYEPVKQTAHDPNRIIASHEFKGAAGRWR